MNQYEIIVDKVNFIKQMAEKTIKETDVKSLLQQAKSDYKTVKNEKIVIEDDDVDDELELV